MNWKTDRREAHFDFTLWKNSFLDWSPEEIAEIASALHTALTEISDRYEDGITIGGAFGHGGIYLEEEE